MTANRSRGAALALWLSLNLLRLIGLGALLWTIAVHGILLKSDASGEDVPVSNSTVNATVTNPVEPALKMATTSPGTLGAGSSSAAVTYVTISSAAMPIETPAAGVPSLLFPGGAIPTSLATDPVIPMITQPAGGVDLDSNVISTPQKRAIVNGAEAVAQDRYIAGSTVPIQQGGMVFAIVHRIYSILALLLLVCAELGLPEVFLLRHLSALSLVGSPVWLGLGKMWFGVDLQRHFVPNGLLLAGQCLIASGALNVLIAVPLCWKQRRMNRLPQLRSREVYFDHNVVQRLCFWKPMPELAYILAYDRKGMDAIKAKLGEDDRSDSGDESDSDDEKRDIESHGSDERDDYPTFTGGSLMDPTSQIERFDQRQHGDGESDDDSDGESEYLADNNPAPPEVMPGIPPQLQGAVRDVRPRFGSQVGVPAINLMPSTPSTIASRSTRRQTMSSARSGDSDQHSTRSRRMTLISEAAGKFPVPPSRAADDTVPKSKPKAHLANPKMDESRLMPPKRRGRRSRSEVPQPAHSGPRRRASEDEVEQDARSMSEWKMPTRPTSSIKSRQSVRFDLKRASSESTSSVHEPMHRMSVGSELGRVYRTSTIERQNRHVPGPYVEDEEEYLSSR